MIRFTLVAGARPNFMKIAPIIAALQQAQIKGQDIHYRLIHTGQHYEASMSDNFFQQLYIPPPDCNLGCSGGSPTEQTANIMLAFEKELLANPTDIMLVVGDVTSTMACSIVAKKMGIPLAHVEAGLRSKDKTMPEELNRIVTDVLSDYYFTTTKEAGENLKKEGVADDKIFFVGNVMIDTLLKHRSRFIAPPIFHQLGLLTKGYFILTLHRPSNVDNLEVLLDWLAVISSNSKHYPIIFPIHPRTEKHLKQAIQSFPNLYIVPPMSYLEFNYLVEHCKAVITDSGGITEETTVMNVPCMTLRNTTERPETCTLGTNQLIGTEPQALVPAMQKLWAGKWQTGSQPPLWDGHAAERIVNILIQLFHGKVA
ncbi:MAG TPA: UDP-N-acetylglucosamine 2-epimerase (non-hydrolyzing) [Flavipsychrobacter sp.]|nr:UDP-N-acetylglucosamine 2-epimerase (non-hydrolyzing) [Flavipsychrobacter sp.]